MFYFLSLIRSDLAYFDGLSETILCAGLVKPKPGMFVCMYLKGHQPQRHAILVKLQNTKRPLCINEDQNVML